MKSKIFLLLIIKVKTIHDFIVLSFSLWIFPNKKKVIGILYHALTQIIKSYSYIKFLSFESKLEKLNLQVFKL